MMTIEQNRAAVWFGRVMWLGILANVALAAPTLIAPERLMAMAGFPAASPLMWVRFSAWLLILLSFMYMPGAIDLYRYRVPALLSVGSRLAGVLFFATQAAEYRLLGVFDFVFLVPEAILLTIALRHAPIVDRRLEGSAAS
jgi:hypothetical protein